MKDVNFLHVEQRGFIRNEAMMDLLFGVNPISDLVLRKLIAKNPAVYSRYERFVGMR